MNKTSRRRVAAVATTATMSGLLLPFLSAGIALADPTSLTVYPASANTNKGGTATFTGSFAGTAGANGIFAKAVTGPDSNGPAQTCVVTGVTYTCNFVNGGTAGTDSLRFFYDVNGDTLYQPTEPSATASLTVADTISSVVLTPTSSSAAQAGYAEYTVSATDASGRPVSNSPVAVSGTQANSAGNFTVTSTKPANGAVFGVPANPTPDAPGAPPVAKTATATTGDGTGTSTAGQAKFYVASDVVGTVNLSVSSGGNGAISAIGTLTVNGGTTNDAAAVAVSPSAQRAFLSDTATVVVNVRNAQGNPISGVNPSVTITSGPDAGKSVTTIGNTDGQTTGTTDGNGNVTVKFPTTVAGTDTLQAYVNQSNHPVNTAGLDTGEPSSAPATVVVDAYVVSSVTANPQNVVVPLSQKSATLTYTVATTDGSSAKGYNVSFAIVKTDPKYADPKYSLSAPSAVSDANGKVTVTLTDANPVDGDAPTVIATVGSATQSQSGSATVSYQANVVANNNVKITPFANTTTTKGTASFSVSATDQFGNPVTGVSYVWTVSGRNNTVNNPGAFGTGPTFSYTDLGPTGVEQKDVVSVQATTASGGRVTVTGGDTADQYWVTTNAVATQANIDLGTGTSQNPTYNGGYTENRAGVPFGQRGPIVAHDFQTTTTTGVTNNPTTENPVVTPTAVRVELTDTGNHRLYGKSVTFSSTGVGVFTDAQGNPIGTSTTALVADQNAVNGDTNAQGQSNGSTADYATVFVRSTQGGTQNIRASVDGVSTNATVTYAGEYVAVTPDRVVDTRTGQGAVTTALTSRFGLGGSAAPAGPLAANTSYYFNYASSQMPLDAAAYVFNVTAITPNGLGNLRVAPAAGGLQPGQVLPSAAPTTSLINYQSGKDVANLAIVPNNGTNLLQLFSAASSANVAIDLVGYYPTSAGITSITPTRIADTRDGGGAVAAGETRSFQVAGKARIPAAATPANGATPAIPAAKAVALNVTVVNPNDLGNLRIFADGVPVPTTSNINYIPGQDKSATVIVDLPADGKISVYSAGASVDVAIDAYAYYSTDTKLVTQTPARILDTRTSTPLAAGGSTNVQVTGQAGVPADAQAVLVSVTGIHTTGSTGSGNLRVYPTGGTLPNVSTLNYVSPTSDVANFAIVKLGANGQITLNTQGSPIDATVDVVGYVPAGGLSTNQGG